MLLLEWSVDRVFSALTLENVNFAGNFPLKSAEQPTSTVINNNTKWYDKYDRVHLPCPFEGSPEPTKVWLFNSKPLVANDVYQIDANNGSALKINELTEVYEGVYTCNASNKLTTTVTNYNVQIAGKLS